MLKSPLRYPGGKSRAVNLISTIIPSFKEYREPFLGGGSLFVFLKQLYPEKFFWINDLYPDLYLFWHYSKENNAELESLICELKSKYEDGKNLHNFLNTNIANFNDLEKAAAFFIYNRITFSGTTLSGGFSNSAFKYRFTRSSIDRLKSLKHILKDVKITNYDYEQLLFKDGDSVLIFLDPPYFSATKSALYGKNGNLHKIFDHKRFADNMKLCKHKWLITYDDNNYIRDLFSFANIFSYNLTYGMRNVIKNSNQTGKEIFISNYLECLPLQNEFKLFNYKNNFESNKPAVTL
jgi:DNA adenine methylase